MSKHLVRLLAPCPRIALGCLVVLHVTAMASRAIELPSSRMTPIVLAVRAAEPAVVSIRGEKELTGTPVSRSTNEVARRVNGMGTGVVIDPRGYLLTNYHVVDGVRDIQVTLSDGRAHSARLVARDAETDLAIVQIDTEARLPVIPVGTSRDLMRGEPVIAVGNAFGYDHTVTRGIISALNRAVQVSDAQSYEELIQTDASINPGNSGGPLLNIEGDMIGINVAVRAGAQGIGFAIPVDKAMAVAAKMLAAHNVKSVRHGLTVEEDDGGLRVVAIEEGSPAAEAGIQPGDLLRSADGDRFQRALDFERALLDRNPGEPVELALRRDAAETEAEIVLSSPAARAASDPVWDALGLELESIPADEFRRRFRNSYRGGLSVVAVRPDSAAAAQGIVEGDVLVGMHVWETVSLDNVSYVINHPNFAAMNPVKFFILRGNETLYGFLSVAAGPDALSRR